jgi:hypothetical protein
MLLSVGFFWLVHAGRSSSLTLMVAGMALGLLLDEVAYPVFAAALAAKVLAKPCRRVPDLLRLLGSGGIGLLLARLVYQAFQALSDLPASSAGAPRSFAALLDLDVWQAAFIPLSDSLVHQSNLAVLTGGGAQGAALAMSAALLVAHLWFWWRCIFATSPERKYGTTTYLAASIMLLFYGLVLGIVLQRVPDFGFEYLHQPRYVMFYQLHLAALAIMVYREYRYVPLTTMARRAACGVLVASILVFGLLQVRLSTLAWEHGKYLSKYVEGAALTLGQLARDPDVEIPCADILLICEFPAEDRRRLLGILVRYRLNLFSPEFQAFYRLYPNPQAPAPTDGQVAASGESASPPVSPLSPVSKP